jgi:hypothetical protein
MALNWFALSIYVFEGVLLYFLRRIRGVGERYSNGMAGWSGGIIALIILFSSGVLGFTPKSGKVIAFGVMATILALVVIIYMIHRPSSRRTFSFVIDIGIAFGLIMPALAVLFT